MLGMDSRRLTDSLLKGAIKGMGPFGLPAAILLDTIDTFMVAQKDEAAQSNAPTAEDIRREVREEVRQQAARDAWSKIEPACSAYFAILGNLDPSGTLRPSDKIKLGELIKLQLGSGSDLRQGLRNIYDGQHRPNDMSTAEHAFPAYALGASVEASLMILDVGRSAKINGMIGPNDWQNVRNTVNERAMAIDRINRHIVSYVIEKQLRSELSAGLLTIGSPEIGQRQEEMEMRLLGGAGAGREIYGSLDRLSELLRGQSEEKIMAQANALLAQAQTA